MSENLHTILADRYELLSEVGRGGMAIVYRAFDQRTGHDVAVKIMRPELSTNAEFVSRFQREAEAASKMTHNNIVNLLDVCKEGDQRYLVMEYVEGQTLKDMITQRGRITPAAAVQITIRILAALDHAHHNSIIHRDIKPQNILVNTNGHVKVADFGIARMADSATLTQDNKVMGSVHYYSPEQASGKPATERSDLYSVGVVLYEMLTGHVPFDGESILAIAYNQVNKQPPPIPDDVPEAISAVCMHALEKDPTKRYGSAKEMAIDLRLAQENRRNEMQANPETMDSTEVFEDSDIPVIRQQPETRKRIRKAAQGNKPRARINVVWWAVTIAMTLLVFYVLYAGAASIYDSVVNSVTVPDFVTSEFSAAERIATRAGLHVEMGTMYHPTVSSGVVVLQTPEEGTVIKRGDTVLLMVSAGPASQTVPSIVNMTLNDAITTAKASDLTITVVERVVSADVQADFVLTQIPEANVQCQPGDIIQVTVSGGLVNVPSVTGRTLADAQELLKGCGLSVNSNVQYIDTNDGALHGTVAQQSLAEGTQVILGTSVALSVYQVPGLTHHQDVELILPSDADSMVTVSVMLVVDGTEIEVYRGSFAADETRHPVVSIPAQIPGEYEYRVYVNGSYRYHENVRIE